RPVGVEEAVDRLVDRAVAADRDDFHIPFAQRVAGEPRGLAAPRGEGDRHARIDVAERALDGAPFAARPAVARTRIDDDERAHASPRVWYSRERPAISLWRRSSLQPRSAASARDTVSSASRGGGPNWPSSVRRMTVWVRASSGSGWRRPGSTAAAVSQARVFAPSFAASLSTMVSAK